MLDDDAYGAVDRDRQTDWARVGDDAPERVAEPVRGWGCISWVCILTLVGFMIFLRARKPDVEEKLLPLDDTPASMQGIAELQIRGLIGCGELIRRLQPGEEAEIRALFDGAPNNAADQAEHTRMWTHGTLGQRMQYVVLAGELAGAQRALELLGRLKLDWELQKLQPEPQQLAVFQALRKSYSDYRDKKFDAPSLKDPERKLLVSKLGWYGKVALTPPDAPDRVTRNSLMESPMRLIYGLLGAFAVIVVGGFLGLGALAILGLGTLTGGIKFGLRPGHSSSGVYAETFALWMLAFMAGMLAIEMWPRPDDRFLLNLVVFFGSLLVLAWPVIRGIPWRQVREDIGLTWGRGGILEPAWGVPGYAMMIPMLVVGVSITFALMVAWALKEGAGNAPQGPFEPQHFVSHPIVNVVLQGGFWVRVQLLLLACVAAPIVEEIMFRGVLYRHVRDATRGFGWVVSCLFSALWVSFIFAAIHPQGMLVVPALMGIACGCTLVREWRDSLWASMIVHALNNGLVFSILLFGTS